MRYAMSMLLILLAMDGASAQAFVGRWYVGDVKTCAGEKGGTQGLLVYTAKEFSGYESNCRIVGTTPKGSAVEMRLRCRAEGTTSNDRELVEVKDSRLTRTLIDGGKRESFTYTRCP
jgi:hypothetical protein